MNKFSKFIFIGAVMAALLLLSASISMAQGGGFTPDNVVKTVTSEGFVFQSYNRPDGTPYSGGQRIRIGLTNGNPYNVCRTNGAGENGTLLGAVVVEGQPFAFVAHPSKGLIMVSPTPDQLATEPRKGRTPICEVTRIGGDANDEDFTVSGLGQFVVVQGHASISSRIQIQLNGQGYSRTNNSGNGDALRLLIFQDDGLTIPVVIAQNFSGGGCTLHAANNTGTGGTDISLDARRVTQLQNFYPAYCSTDLIPD